MIPNRITGGVVHNLVIMSTPAQVLWVGVHAAAPNNGELNHKRQNPLQMVRFCGLETKDKDCCHRTKTAVNVNHGQEPCG